MREGRAEPCPYGVGMQKNRPYQLDIYTVSFHAIPRQARGQDSFGIFLRGDAKGRYKEIKREIQGNKKGDIKKQKGGCKRKSGKREKKGKTGSIGNHKRKLRFLGKA